MCRNRMHLISKLKLISTMDGFIWNEWWNGMFWTKNHRTHIEQSKRRWQNALCTARRFLIVHLNGCVVQRAIRAAFRIVASKCTASARCTYVDFLKRTQRPHSARHSHRRSGSLGSVFGSSGIGAVPDARTNRERKTKHEKCCADTAHGYNTMCVCTSFMHRITHFYGLSLEAILIGIYGKLLCVVAGEMGTTWYTKFIGWQKCGGFWFRVGHRHSVELVTGNPSIRVISGARIRDCPVPAGTRKCLVLHLLLLLPHFSQ